jgi:hypothetical protein
MRIHIEQKVKEDDHGIDSDHVDYDAWREGIVQVWMVTTTAICLESGRKADSALFGIVCTPDDQSYLRTVKGEQMREVLAELGFDF